MLFVMIESLQIGAICLIIPPHQTLNILFLSEHTQSSQSSILKMLILFQLLYMLRPRPNVTHVIKYGRTRNS